MKTNCPNKSCQNPNDFIKDGNFKRACDSRLIQRFRCKSCGTRFSSATHKLERYQKKRRINFELFKLLSTGVSQRKAARHFKINYKTVVRKVDYLSKKSELKNKIFLKKLEKEKVLEIQFDDLLTSEHTKMKPLSVSLAVDKKRRFILAAEVSRIPAFGHLAEKSRKKYGHRENKHIDGLNRMFKKIKPLVCDETLFESDEHPTYPKILGQYFKHNMHKRYLGGRSCIAGQGELKKKSFDPLFTLNHTCAMLRDGISRLIRKTWCGSKKPELLQKHLNIFICFYNLYYLKGWLTPF